MPEDHATDAITVHPLTPECWSDLEDLFGPQRGANSGCWCMWLRVGSALYRDMERAGRRDAFRAVVEQGPPPGLLAYHGGEAVGWCAVGPRETLPRFQSGKTSRPPEDVAAGSVYAISCFFIRSGWRKRGLTRVLAGAARDFAGQAGAQALDVCAIEPDKRLQWGEGFVGIASVFADLGFREIARRSPKRPLMRLDLTPLSNNYQAISKSP